MRFHALLALVVLACGGKSISPIDEPTEQPASAPSASNTVAAPAPNAPITTVDAGPSKEPSPAARPEASPKAGTFSSCPSVTLSSATPLALIRYTLDGTDPTAQSTPYDGPILLKQTTAIRARAFSAGFGPSDVMIATYVLNRQDYGIIPVDFDPPAQTTQSGTLNVTLSQPSPTNFVCYTRDGSEPNCDLATCGAVGENVRVRVESSTKLRAVACMRKEPTGSDCGLNPWKSDVSEAVYTLQ